VIAKLAGLVDSVERDRAVIDVQGVGYLVRGSSRTLATLAAGETTSLQIETIVREDAIDLYAFATTSERDWFRLLTTVQGVGAKVALSLLSALAPSDLARAIGSSDRAMLTRAEGVGPKLANRLASELKDKVGNLAVVIPAGPGKAPVRFDGGDNAGDDAISALVNLGYRRAEAAAAIDRVRARLGDHAALERLIPEGLKELTR
jgi:Holliday junction DNA helicase RuvA